MVTPGSSGVGPEGPFWDWWGTIGGEHRPKPRAWGRRGELSPSRSLCAWRQVLSARALCPRSASPTPEPSFPLYLDVLAPYVNQVNLIRAGVPKIVSTVPSLLPGQRLP